LEFLDAAPSQAEAAPTQPAAAAPEPEPAELQSATRKPDLRLDEVIVTAQKRAEDVQDVPISVTAIGGEQIREMNLQGTTELTIVMPNATLAVSPTFATVYVRGIGTGLNDGFETSVGLYVDGIYLGRQTYLNDSLMDMEVVELLRGPQGTLFGKNTVAGALNITNTIPEYDFSAAVDLSYGEHNIRRGNVYVNMPVVDDKFALRFSGQWARSDGAIFNETRGVSELRNDKASVRLKARADFTEDLYMTAAIEASKVKDTGAGFELVKASDEQIAFYQLFDPTTEAHANRVSHLDADNYAKRETFGGNINIFYSLNEYELAFIGGYNTFNEQYLYDSDASPFPLLSWDNDDEYSQWQAEVRLLSPPGRIEYVAGLFYFGNKYTGGTEFRQFDDENLVGTVAGGVLPVPIETALSALLIPLTGGVNSLTDIVTQDALFAVFDQETHTYAAYTQITLRPWSWFEFVSGIRAHYETKEATIAQEFESTGAFLNAAFGTQEYDFAGSASETAITPKVVAKWLVNDDVNVFFTVGKGYKAGGFNPTAPDPSKTQFDEETSWTYELGVKSAWFDNRMTANVTGFRTEFRDMQISVLSGAGEAFFVDNAASSTVQGFEWEVKGVLWEGNMTIFGGGFLHAYYDDFRRGPCEAGEEGDADGFCDMTGERMVRAPKWDIMASFNQAFPLGNLPFGAYVGFDWVTQTDHYTDQDNDPNTLQDAYMVLNARFGIGDIDQNWSLSINGHNVLKEKIIGGITDTPLFEGSYFGIIAPEGAWIAEFRMNL
ncbi:MAG: TonB-dependent receptor, partial [Alphaproteobacteria bacterium]